MLNLLEDQLLYDAVSRAEQSRFSYNLQAEEFRNLNANLQTYLNDIQKIDEENHQLQDNINQIRTNYILTLENHLKRLPDDFRQESYTLNEAHLERYKSKSRARRFINEREEFKKRIQFLVNNEKDQIKYLNNLQRQERLIHNDFQKLNEQIKNLYTYVQTEKQTHRQAMDKVDNLQIQLEQICIERSKTEFDIQTLREEVKLMQTTKEFLDEEHQSILSTQTDANEYFLSFLNESILRIREDFDKLNQTQLDQIENEYKQTMKILEDNSSINTTINEKMINQQHLIQIQYEKLQDEQQSIIQELTTVNNNNQLLSEQILAMEADLYSIRNGRVQELIIKDNELEQSKIELQSLNEKLTHLAEYDRNLKFELTLYRGVLENEYRRKQQQLNNNQHPIRPTTLRSNKTFSTLTNRNQFESIEKKSNTQFDEIMSTKTYTNDEKIEDKTDLDNQENLSQETNKSLNEDQQKQIEQTLVETIKSPISTIPTDRRPSSESQSSSKILPIDQEVSITSTASAPDLLSSSTDLQTTLEVSELPTSSADSILPKDQSTTSDTPSPSQAVPTDSPIKSEASLTSTPVHDFPSTPSKDHQTPTDIPELPSIPLSTSPQSQSEAQESSTTPPVNEDEQKPSEVHQLHATSQEEVPQSPKTSPIAEQIPSNTLQSPLSPSNTALSTDLSTSSEIHQKSSNTSSNQQSLPIKSPSTPQEEDQSNLSDIQKNVSTPSQEESSSMATNEDQITTPASDSTTSNFTAEEIDNKNQLDTDDTNIEHKEPRKSSIHETHEVAINKLANTDHRKSTDSIKSSTMEEQPSDKQESSSIDLSLASQNETNPNNESLLELDQITTEEQINSSDQNKFEENNKINLISSTGYYGSLNDSTYLKDENLNKESPLTDTEYDNTNLIGEANSSTSPKIEEKQFTSNNELNLEAVMQDLRYVYRDLMNDENSVEINDDFPDNLIERLEFGDNFMRTLFDEFLRKYIVEPAKIETRSNVLDWIEFRDILFPIITGRYMERHIRKLFELCDTSRDGHLSLQEITELLELLQINNANKLAQNIIDQLDKNNDEKLNINEFIEGVKQVNDVYNNILSDEMEDKSWYNQHPTDEDNNDNESISLEVPTINYPSKIDNEIMLLARIFKRVGADAENKQLDSNKPTLSMKITNEFINNNIHISSNDLQLFTELYLKEKQKTDGFIKWIEFRDIFFPFVNHGLCSKDDIIRWFNILDDNHNGIINREQILHLLRLLRISKPDEILNEISQKYANNNNSWTLEELISALENLNVPTIHLYPINDQIKFFDLDWLTKNIF